MKRVILLSFSMLIPALSLPAHADGNAGHALAQKFAVEDGKQRPAPAMAGPAAKPAQVQAQAPVPAKPKAPAPAAAPTKDDETEMLEAARAEAEARKAQEKSGVAPTIVAAQPAPEAAAQPVATQPVVTPPAIAPAKPSASAAVAKATVLVVLTQSTAQGASPKTFDPILCFGDACYVSTGVGTQARALARDEALSTKNSMTTGAGACAGRQSCAFRGISVEQGAALQIVDLGLVHHDRHEPLEAKVDSTCLLDDSDLICRKPVTAPDYRVWIVPEALADQAGADKIAAALADELPEENVTLDTDK